MLNYIIFFIITCILYASFGNMSAIKTYYNQDQIKFRESLPAIQKKINLDKMQIATNEVKVNIDPNYLTGWKELAELYQLYEQYEKAEVAYKNAMVLAVNDENLSYNYLRLKAHMQDGKFLNEEQQLLAKLLHNNPEHKGALNLCAANNFKNKNYHQAIIYWNKIIALLDPNNQEHNNTKKLLEIMISKANNELKNS
jgi:cytochrome c-type biogenesis protein CcmH